MSSKEGSRQRGAVGALVVGGDYQGLGIARSLGRQGVPVCVLDDEFSIASASRFVQRHVRVQDLRGAQQTIAALVEVAQRLQLQGWVLYPTREETVAAVASNRDKLSELLRVPTPAWSSVHPAWDKRETYQLADRLGVPTPRTWFPQNERDLELIEVDSPVVVKPAIKEHFFYATGAKAWRADNADELVAAYRRACSVVQPGEVLVQEMIPGGGERQVAYCTFFKEGRSLASMTVRRRRQHPSDFGRASTFVETIELPELEKPSVRFLQEIDYYGLAELEYKQDPRDGGYKLLDVNPRTWGYHSLGPAAGVDFPYLLFRDQLGLPVQSVKARTGVRWVRLATDLPNAVRDIRAGTAHTGDYLRSLRGVDTEAVFSLRDPLPGLYEVAMLPYLAVKRGL
ncbi:MAG: D-aspartate ligase [Nocardioidaceae bacterium]|jgi:predicted ATP-grasp superfamily ATP-dependent carboligase|nr:D-aspartate ligase [Nocardioidaceae bacterium]